MSRSHIDFILNAFRANAERPAVLSEKGTTTYGELLDDFERRDRALVEAGLRPGMVVALESDYSPGTVALLLTLAARECIVVPLTEAVAAHKHEFRETAGVECIVKVDAGDDHSTSFIPYDAQHELIATLRGQGQPGLVIFTSGSSGQSKAVLHALPALLDKLRSPRRGRRTLAFWLFDHIGGINQLFNVLSCAGTVVCVPDRRVDTVCRAVERFEVEVLPASPTFLNLMLLAGAPARYSLSSLEIVQYSSEVMPESTLRRFRAAWPHVRLQQSYGLSELGILRTRSESSDSTGLSIEGDDQKFRVVDGLLEVRTPAAMLGYLNAPDPFTPDGWFRTGDRVRREGDQLHFLGREGEIINTGGEKVFPAEVENVLLMMDEVEDAYVSGEANAIAGQIVRAVLKISQELRPADFRKRVRKFCSDYLAPHKVPQKILLTQTDLHGHRMKKARQDTTL